MLSFDDPRWDELRGGYRVPVDFRPLLTRLESDQDARATWDELWEELYHQGDIGDASFVVVPHLVRIHRKRNAVDWNTYAIAASVELARGTDGNPDVPSWAREAYEDALRELARVGVGELARAGDSEAVRSILAVLAIVHGARTYGRLLLEFTEGEIMELEEAAFGDPDGDAG